MSSHALQRLCAAAASVVLFAAADLLAQSAPDRVIGADDQGAPVTIRQLEDLGRVTRASGVPIGVEQLGGTAFSPFREFTATGLTLRAALDEVQRRDSRYSWRDVNGVIVIRPKTEWDRAGHVLDSQVGPVRASRIAARHALRIACAAVGVATRRSGTTIPWSSTSTFPAARCSNCSTPSSRVTVGCRGGLNTSPRTASFRSL
jgi:hypothetical protein